jgi:hypothetical protein
LSKFNIYGASFFVFQSATHSHDFISCLFFDKLTKIKKNEVAGKGSEWGKGSDITGKGGGMKGDSTTGKGVGKGDSSGTGGRGHSTGKGDGNGSLSGKGCTSWPNNK